jgi:GTPase SAR1 family protein
LSSHDDKLQRGLIITDDISPAPILDFDKYRDAIIKIIKESYPKFSIGIYGDWGSGKTTLMQSVYDQLEKENKDKEKPIILVWFNAWRYEREEHFTIIPLLKTIEYKIPPKKYESLKKSFKEAAIFGLKISKDFVSGIVGNYFGKEAKDLTKEGISDLIDRVIPNLEKINELEKTTIYFEGQEKIEREVKRLRDDNRDFRIVVFVDDLDRCSPQKVIEVFESIKIFLGLDGFIYVLGLSQKKIAQAIRKKYEFEKEEEGDHYIKKIIQIPISLSEWNDDDVKDLLNDFLSKNIIHKTYQDIINNNIGLVFKAVENNPREVKRFLNNFIVACEIFLKDNNKEEKDKKEKDKTKNLLVIQAIQIRWNSFYYLLVKHGVKFCEELKKYVDLSNEERMEKLDSKVNDEKFDYDFKEILRNYKSNLDLWNFIRDQQNVLFNIKDFSPYRRAAESTKDVSVVPEIKPSSIIEEPRMEKPRIYLGLILSSLDNIMYTLDSIVTPDSKTSHELHLIKNEVNNVKNISNIGIKDEHAEIPYLIKKLDIIEDRIQRIVIEENDRIDKIDREKLGSILHVLKDIRIEFFNLNHFR